MKKLISGFILLITILLQVSVLATGQVQNGDFEIVEQAQPPAGWYSEAYLPSAHSFTSSSNDNNGTVCAVLTNTQKNDSRIYQKVECLPNTYYLLTAWVRTEGVQATADAAGASITVQQDGGKTTNFVSSMHIDDECTAWTEVCLYIQTSSQCSAFYIWLRLGDFAMDNTGTAYFDDVALRVTDSVPQGEEVAYLGDPETPGLFSSIGGFLPLIALVLLVLAIGIYLLQRARKMEKANAHDAATLADATPADATHMQSNHGTDSAPQSSIDEDYDDI